MIYDKKMSYIVSLNIFYKNHRNPTTLLLTVIYFSLRICKNFPIGLYAV